MTAIDLRTASNEKLLEILKVAVWKGNWEGVIKHIGIRLHRLTLLERSHKKNMVRNAKYWIKNVAKSEYGYHCPKCDTWFEDVGYREAGILCPECKKRRYALVGVCHRERLSH